VRRLGVVYVCVTLPLVAAVGAAVHGTLQYCLAFVLLASGLYTTPALVITWLVTRRAPVVDRRLWVLWFVGLVLIYSTGLAILAGAATGWRWGNAIGTPLIVLIGILFGASLAGMIRNRSGRRRLSVDVVECHMTLILIAAIVVQLWGERIVTADAAWFTVPAALAAVAMVSGLYWATAMFVRLGPERRAAEWFGLALAVLGAANGVAQLAQGLSGFTLPGAPLLALQAACMSLLLLLPLYVPAGVALGLDRLPPQAQVRSGGLALGLMLVGVPVLLVSTVMVQDRQAWATTFALAAMGVLLVLAALRQFVGVRETSHLYAQVAEASEERRRLLTRVIRRIEDDRHVVAAQLHEQAMSAYATFVSFIQATARSPVGRSASSASLAEASVLVRDDLARQAESLRQLMLAIRPLSIDNEQPRPDEDGLTASIRAYLDSLYGDARTPQLTVAVDAALVLDWITETLVLRIVQEAVRNVWRHSAASRLNVDLRAAAGAGASGLEVRVEDDGRGFDPDANLFESGIAAMRSFAAFSGGTLQVDSAPGEGTVVSVRLGNGVPTARPATPPRGLRLVE
jgi:signal transduction histidine kinase